MGASVLGGLDGTGLVSTESAVIINDGCCVLVLLEGDGAIIPFAESWSMLTVYEDEFQIRNGHGQHRTSRSSFSTFFLLSASSFLQSFQVNNHKPACLRSADVLVLLAGLLFFADDQVSQRGLAGVSAAVELL